MSFQIHDITIFFLTKSPKLPKVSKFIYVAIYTSNYSLNPFISNSQIHM